VTVGIIRRKPVLTHASIVCEGMLASVNSVRIRINVRVSIMVRVSIRTSSVLFSTPVDGK